MRQAGQAIDTNRLSNLAHNVDGQQSDHSSSTETPTCG
jgi:hypothetical protein